MTYQVPLPDPNSASQYFDIFNAEAPTIERIRVDVLRDGKLVSTPILEGGKAKITNLPMVGYHREVIGPGPQLTSRVSPVFSSQVLEHPTQEGFSLDHVHAKLNTFEVEATLYEGRVERFEKLNELRINNTLLTIICDMGVFKNYIISDVSPIMSLSSANAFDASIAFQEVRKVPIISPDIITYTDVEEHGNDIKDEGKVVIGLRGQKISEEKETSWLHPIFDFMYILPQTHIIALARKFL